mmetsp:Transcript_97239/g.119126  ORF Transcript_97239/g.119126 Transcript_97239/m.119126 type:complete len:96 (+) Transcript_97239:635-922(+)
MRRRLGKPSAANGGETKGLPIDACSFPFKSSIFHSTRVHLGPAAWKPKILMPGGSSRLTLSTGPASGGSAASPGGPGGPGGGGGGAMGPTEATGG